MNMTKDDIHSEFKNHTQTSVATIDISEQTNEFHFPFDPYDIQLQLMKAAYQSYDQSKFAILESPTGTGKSLSLICSSLTWLLNYQSKHRQQLEDQKEELSQKIEELKRQELENGDWLTAQTKRQDLNRKFDELKLQLQKIYKIEQKSEARSLAKIHQKPLDDFAVFSKVNNKSDDLTKEDIENRNAKFILSSQESANIDDEDDIEKKLVPDEEDVVRPKIYFASRTHSQLSQFVNEVKRTRFADCLNPVSGYPVKVVPLASRANLCVNMEVLKLKDSAAINERCMEMQKETNKEKRCPYAKPKQVNLLKEEILTTVQDIEDIAARGKFIGSCAYYAARMAVPEAELVVLPYNNLLHHETRRASSLDLRDNVIIIDEAHNILETICSIHSATITGQQLIGSHTILSRYYRKFKTRMSPKNAIVINNIVKCLTAIIRFLNNPKKYLEDNIDIKPNSEFSENDSSKTNAKQPVKSEEFMVDVSKFIIAATIEQFNIFKLIDYFNRSQLARKLIGFYRQDNGLDLTIELFGMTDDESGKPIKSQMNQTSENHKKKRQKLPPNEKVATKDPKVKGNLSDFTSLEFLKETNLSLRTNQLTMSSYPIYTLVEFLRSLTNLVHDGKVLVSFVNGDIQQSALKFVLLNPSSQFKQMAEEARSIVLAGGTMQPFNEFTDLLYKPLGIDENRISLFSCGHVVSPKQLYVSTLCAGPTGKPLELSYKTRFSFENIDEIGRSLLNLASVAPAGMVCFLPSYEYEQFCFNRWTHVGIIRNIETKFKQVFREPRLTSQLKTVLDEYSRCVEKGLTNSRGALLFCVVGGKMSEGINFNDHLGRCIVMVGLPYANIKSGELQQKMSYYDRSCTMSIKGQQQVSAGQQYYENLCIKGINQSIGRAIRHRNDYAAIVLLDRRYSTKESIRKGLPGWIRGSLVDHSQFGPLLLQLKSFFEARESK